MSTFVQKPINKHSTKLYLNPLNQQSLKKGTEPRRNWGIRQTSKLSYSEQNETHFQFP